MKITRVVSAGLLSCVSVAAFAAPEVKMKGYFEGRYGYIKQEKEYTYENPGDTESKKLSDKGIVTGSMLVNFEAMETLSSGAKVGAIVKLKANTNDTTAASKGVLYVEGDFGRVEVGPYNGVSSKLRVTGSEWDLGDGASTLSSWLNPKSVAKVDAAGKDSSDVAATGAEYVSYSDAFLVAPRLAIGSARENKLTYYSPEFGANGHMVKAGFSYIPDTAVQGTVSSLTKANTKLSEGSKDKPFENMHQYTDVVDLGLKYTCDSLYDGLKVELGGAFQFGKAKDYSRGIIGNEDADKADTKTAREAIKRRNAQAWSLGVSLDFRDMVQFSLAYADLAKSGTRKTALDDAKKHGASYLDTTVCYKFAEKYGVSLSYFTSRKAGGNLYVADIGWNKFSDIALGLEYNITDQSRFYVSAVNFKSTLANKVDGTKQKANKGNFFLTGLVLKF